MICRDDCASLSQRAEGETVICAVYSKSDPPTLTDGTGIFFNFLVKDALTLLIRFSAPLVYHHA